VLDEVRAAQPVVAVASGKLRGRTVGGVTAFLGVRYAAAPAGSRSFAAPVPVERWDGVRDAFELGPTAPQFQYTPPFDRLIYNPLIPGEDCLHVNVWTPDPGGSGLPVMVWIHGGAFRNGSNALPIYDGSAFARDGVVVVSLNYRVGAAGFAVVPGAPNNRGLLDQLVALEWVQDNVAAFGGDPGRVTVFGESAGAMSVATLLSLPQARGLFGRAILQSGSGSAVLAEADGRRLTAALTAKLAVEPTAQALSDVETSVRIEAERALAIEVRENPSAERWGPSIAASLGLMAFAPVLDGELIAARPVDAIAAGAGRECDLLLGTTTDEMGLFLVPTGVSASVTDEMLSGLVAARGVDPAIAAVYAANRPGASPGETLVAILTDMFFRVPTLRIAEGHARVGGATFTYEFAWRTPVQELGGACHALELPFVFDTLAERGAEELAGPNPPQALADGMHAAWVAFATRGDPGWRAFDPASRAVMSFNQPSSALLDDPRAAERALWEHAI
jgi:para-nitrobenzyl esterase